LSLYIGTFSKHIVLIVFMGLWDNVKELKKVKIKIVVCDDRNETSLFDQVNNLNAAKVLGVILISNVSAIDLNTTPKKFVAFKLLTW